MNKSRWSTGWNPSNPIKELFNRLEECYVIAIVALPPYMMEQMIDKAHISVQRTGLYELAIIKWNRFNLASKSWSDFKAHFDKAYDTRLGLGVGSQHCKYQRLF